MVKTSSIEKDDAHNARARDVLSASVASLGVAELGIIREGGGEGLVKSR